MIIADGVILATDGKNSLYVIEPSPVGFKPLASSEVLKPAAKPDNNQTATPNQAGPSRMGGMAQNWGPIALSDGKLLIRDQSRLMCVRVAK